MKTLLLLGLLWAPTVSSGADASLDTLRSEAVRHLYNLDYEDADRLYRRITEGWPDRPIGPYNRATVVWSRLARRSGGMRGSSHRGDRYWSQTTKLEPTEAETAQFRAGVEEALTRAERLLEADPGDLDALYYLGATQALESGWEIVVERSYLGGYRSIRRGVNSHRRLIAEAPDHADAYAVPGAYDYGLATLPRALRFIARLFGVRGDLAEGLAGVRRAAYEGDRARWGALWTWSILMQREERYGEALAAATLLTEAFPKNPDLALEVPSIRIAQGDFVRARGAVERFLGRRGEGFGNYHLAAPGVAEILYGEAWLFDEEWERAEEALTAGLAADPMPEEEAMLLFRRGNAHDGAGNRTAAIADYLAVRRNGSDGILVDWAAALMQTPWPAGAPEGSIPTPPSP